jgi:hypothetical protein
MTHWDAFCNVWVFIGMVASGQWKPTKRERQKITDMVGTTEGTTMTLVEHLDYANVITRDKTTAPCDGSGLSTAGLAQTGSGRFLCPFCEKPIKAKR